MNVRIGGCKSKEIFRKQRSPRIRISSDLICSEDEQNSDSHTTRHIAYVDDLQIGHHHTNLNVMEKMQGCFDKVQNWALKNDFYLLTQYKQSSSFNINQALCNSPVLNLNERES